MLRPLPTHTLFPYTTLFRSPSRTAPATDLRVSSTSSSRESSMFRLPRNLRPASTQNRSHNPISRSHFSTPRSEEHTSELQSHSDLVCRLLLEKKKIKGSHSS